MGFASVDTRAVAAPLGESVLCEPPCSTRTRRWFAVPAWLAGAHDLRDAALRYANRFVRLRPLAAANCLRVWRSAN